MLAKANCSTKDSHDYTEREVCIEDRELGIAICAMISFDSFKNSKTMDNFITSITTTAINKFLS